MNTNETPAIRDIAAAAGYYRHIDSERLLAALRKEPGCEDVQERQLRNYLSRKTKRLPPAIAIGLAHVLQTSVETIMRAAAEG